MSAVGIITEYNPFHNGHLIHLNVAKSISDDVIAVMSGNFVQRGEPAVCDKFSRARMALISGVSIVLELPVFYSTGSAELFAHGAVAELNCTGIVDSICFGAETGNLTLLFEIAEFLAEEGENFKARLRTLLNTGLPFAKARHMAVCLNIPDAAEILTKPNNILAVEYLKALKRLGSGITPHITPRKGAGHDSEGITCGVSSASHIRKMVSRGNCEGLYEVMPVHTAEIIIGEISQKRAPNLMDNYSLLLHYILLGENFNTLMKIDSISREEEGLLRRIMKSAKDNFTISDIVSAAKTKRFAHSAIKRQVLGLLLGKNDYKRPREGRPEYIRVLGFRRDKSALLSKLVKSSEIPVITNLKHARKILEGNESALAALEEDLRAGEIYRLGITAGGGNMPNEAETPVVIV